MKRHRLIAVIGLIMIAILLATCGGTEVTPSAVSEAATANSTPISSTAKFASIPADTPISATPASTPIPMSTPTPAPTVTPVAGIGVPVVGGHWQITLEDVRQETQLTGGHGINTTTYYAKDGHTLLVVEGTFHNLDPTQQTKLSTEDIALISEDGESLAADGAGSGSNYCVGCTQTVSTMGDELSHGFVFALEEKVLDQVFKFQFKEAPPIPFSVEAEAEYPYQTEIDNEPAPLPSMCEAEGLPPLDDVGQLTFQRWEKEGLVLAAISPDGVDTNQVCAGLAFGHLQLAADGAALLLSGPQQGWPSLYLIEPEGKIYFLVKNGQEIKARFDPTGRWALFTTRKLGETGEELYIFDRETSLTTLLNKGAQVDFRFLADGRLLVMSNVTIDSAPQYYLGQADGSTLEHLDIPADILASERIEISADGQHLIYIEQDESWDKHLFFADLDGSNAQELAQTEHWDLQGVLSPDGRFILIEIDEGYGVGRRAKLRNLATDESWIILTGSNNLEFGFSPDSRWALVFSTVRGSGLEAEVLHTMYIVDTADGNVREIAGATNGFFSPDSTRLAYTLRHAEGNLEMYVTTPNGEASQSLGPGVLTGWLPLGIINSDEPTSAKQD